MVLSFRTRKQGREAAPFPRTQSPSTRLRFAPATPLDDSEHFLENHHVSVAPLRLLFTFAPERRSAPFTFSGIPNLDVHRVGASWITSSRFSWRFGRLRLLRLWKLRPVGPNHQVKPAEVRRACLAPGGAFWLSRGLKYPERLVPGALRRLVTRRLRMHPA
jgi:hypothetical protein